MASYTFLWSMHALLGATAIFLIYPFGALRFKAQITPLWLPHWTIQTFGNTVLLATAALGLFGSSHIHDSHQIAGIALVAVMLLQSFIGHSIQSLHWRPRLQQWIKHQHAIQGSICLLVGWWTTISGLRLANFDSTTIIYIGLTTLTEMIGVTMYCGIMRWRKSDADYSQVDAEDSEGEKETC